MALFGRETARDEEKVEAYRLWFNRQHPLALASVALSIFSFAHFGTLFLDELAGIALGVIAIRAVRRGDATRSAKLAYVGVAIGAISLVCAIVIYTWPLAARG